MDARQRWQALQAHLKESRSRLEQRQFAEALEAVDAALALDPDFLAALSLRDRIVWMAPELPFSQAFMAAPPPAETNPPSPVERVLEAPRPVAAAGDLPLAAVDGFALNARHENEPAIPELPLTTIDDLPLVPPAPTAAFVGTQPSAQHPVAAADGPPQRTVAAVKSSVPAAKFDAAQPAAAEPSASPPAEPLVSTEGYARFEQRARRRRVDRRLDAVRSALAQGRLKEAASALEEVVALDPNLPELRDLAQQYDRLRRARGRRHPGRWLAAAATFGGIVLGASWLQDGTGLRSRTIAPVSSVVEPRESPGAPTPAADPAVDALASTPTTGSVEERTAAMQPSAAAEKTAAQPAERTASDSRQAALVQRQPDRTTIDSREAALVGRQPDRTDAPSAPRPDAVPATTPQTVASRLALEPAGPVAPISNTVAPVPPPVMPAVQSQPSGVAAPQAMNVPPPPVAAPPAPPASASANSAAAPTTVTRTRDDERLIEEVLQRYRSAYEGLDARSARAVWPAVNEAALARAFDGLESQRVTFDACDVRLRGEAAAATCRGSARYVPKVGSREPRVESLTWNFTLKKDGTDWKIESARAAR